MNHRALNVFRIRFLLTLQAKEGVTTTSLAKCFLRTPDFCQTFHDFPARFCVASAERKLNEFIPFPAAFPDCLEGTSLRQWVLILVSWVPKQRRVSKSQTGSGNFKMQNRNAFLKYIYINVILLEI